MNTVRNSVNFLPELQPQHVSLAFEDCSFIRPHFAKCYFKGTGFYRCQVEGPRLVACDFSGADADEPWWQPEDQADPYLQVLRELMPAVEKAVGADHPSTRGLRLFVQSYESNPLIGDDFTSHMMLDKIPAADFRKLARLIDRATAELED